MSVVAEPTADRHETPREVWVRYSGDEVCTTCLRHDLPAAA
jgi:hypothetical protein